MMEKHNIYLNYEFCERCVNRKRNILIMIYINVIKT